MPELPDVAVFKKYLDATCLHKDVTGVSVENEAVLRGETPQGLGRKLAGKSLESSLTHGKHLFVRLSGDSRLLMLHFGMTGYLKHYSHPEDAPDHERLRLSFADGSCLGLSSQRLLGEVEMVEDLKAYLEERDLGPDALDEAFTKKDFITAMRGRRSMLKTALMNQSIMAGVGNVYSDEILFQAGLHPKTRVQSLSDSDLEDVYRIMRRVLKKAIEKGADPERLPSTWLTPRRKKGERCPRCNDSVKRIEVSGRGCYLCPNCQIMK